MCQINIISLNSVESFVMFDTKCNLFLIEKGFGRIPLTSQN